MTTRVLVYTAKAKRSLAIAIKLMASTLLGTSTGRRTNLFQKAFNFILLFTFWLSSEIQFQENCQKHREANRTSKSRCDVTVEPNALLLHTQSVESGIHVFKLRKSKNKKNIIQNFRTIQRVCVFQVQPRARVPCQICALRLWKLWKQAIWELNSLQM